MASVLSLNISHLPPVATSLEKRKGEQFRIAVQKAGRHAESGEILFARG